MSEECYKKKRRDLVFWPPRMLLVYLLSFLFSGTVNAQDKTRVSGNIMDENLQPVIGATITVEGTTLGTSSDARGSFSLEVPASGKLQFGFIGYQTQTVPIERNKTYNIQLLPDATNIDDVVVVGFGTQKKGECDRCHRLGSGDRTFGLLQIGPESDACGQHSGNHRRAAVGRGRQRPGRFLDPRHGHLQGQYVAADFGRWRRA